MTIGILGGGVWGSALARVLSNNKVIIYAREEKIVKSINEHKINPKLKYSSFNENVTATTCLLYTSPSPRDGLLSRMPSSA